MKRTLVALTMLVLLLGAACASTSAPTATGVITAVDGSTITVAAPAGAAPVTYTMTRSTNVYAADGVLAQRSYLASGQRVQVWANGTSAVRINIAP